MKKSIEIYHPGTFEPDNHFYPEVINADLHPILKSFFNMSREQLVERYLHLHPRVPREFIETTLSYKCKHFRWSGADLIFVSTGPGHRYSVVIETNSCPSGQKSMPFIDENNPQKSYADVINATIRDYVNKDKLNSGELAVFYDINEMESAGYASTMADIFNRPVYLAKLPQGGNPDVKFEDNFFHINHGGSWKKISACFRFVTQSPWDRIPVSCGTYILNPVLSCLGGGRNKLIAKKAYDLYNAEIKENNISILSPETITDISKEEIPLWIDKFGGFGVIKIPYGNCGQGIYTITNQEELERFMESDADYDQYIVQSLIGNYSWSSSGTAGKFFHLGTIPDRKNRIFVSDLRFMVCSSKKGFMPIAIYGRRARQPLTNTVPEGDSSWGMLGTNLSYKDDDGILKSESSRLIMMDRKDFSQLGIGLDDIINSYMQTVLSTIAVDKMCKRLLTTKGKFKKKLFNSLNTDPKLLEQIYIGDDN